MIDTLSETVFSLTEATKLIPARRGGKKPHVSCLYRWTIGGCRGVVLESLCIGGTRCTSREALQRFFAALSEQAGIPGTSPTLRTSKQRERDIDRAEAELKAAGY
jgi:hypothetical protein